MIAIDARRALVAAALLGALALVSCGGGGGGGGANATDPPPADPRFLVSGTSPFTAGCDGAPASGVLYANAEVEPYVAVNPRNANHLIGVWQQDRWSNGGARGLLTGYSVDGGRTWAPAMAPLSRCNGGSVANGADYARASDPWVSIAPDGTAYQISLSFNGATLTPGSENAVLVSRSADGGRTWSAAATLIRDGADHFNDKESITADRADARYVYAAWDRLAPDGTAPSWFVRTTDGGASWETARAVYDPGPDASTLDNQIVVLPDGALILFLTRFTTVNGTTAAAFVVLRSTDKGVTWSAPITVAAVQALGTVDPVSGRSVRDGAFLGAIAAGPRGDLAIVWQDARFTQGARDGIAFARSADGGLTWSAPARINADSSVAAFTPAVTIRADGGIGVTYYDLRSNTSDVATILTDYWITRSTDAGATWKETRLAGPFDLATAPTASGLFLGDYQGLVSTGDAFVPFYALAGSGNTGNRTDVFASIVSSLAAPTSAQAMRVPAQAPATSGAPTATVTTAAPADPLSLTPEVAAALHESAARVKARRIVGQ